MANNQGKEASNKEAAADKGQIHPPAITLPIGGGAIRGIGEKFAANPVTGTGSMTVPIATSPGRSGFGPQLSLSYDSGSGNGPFGFGWSLSLPSITRKTDKGLPRYWDAEESDVFILSGAEDLVPVFKKKANGDWELDEDGHHVIDEIDRDGYKVRRYRPRIEGLFARIERWTDQTDLKDTFWRSISKDNITTWYGKTDNSRIFDPVEPTHIFSWLICQSYDDKGNAILYEYAPEDSAGIDESQAHENNRTPDTRKANRYLKRIVYGNLKPNRDANWQATDPSTMKNADGLFHEDWMFEVVFDYREGHYSEQKAPDSSHHDYAFALIEPPAGSTWPVRQDPFANYRAGFEVRTYRLCHRVLMFHHFPDELGIDDYLVRSTEFTYDPSPIASFIKSVTQSGYRYIDEKKYLKKSLPPLEFKYSKADIQEDVQEIDAESLKNLPNGLDNSRYQWVDLDGEGISGILTEQADAWFYKANLGNGRFGPLETVAVKPSLAALGSGQQQLLDLAGDGQLDLVEFIGPTPGFYERTEDQDWKQFRPFISLPNIPWNDPNLRFVDLTGDGHADVLITENEVFTWYPSLAEEGFGQAERVRQALEEEKRPRLVFADGTQSIYLADLSGDGLSDLARIRNGEVCYWPNLGYGRFGAKVTMDNAPWFDASDLFDQKRIRLADIDGSGTTDIIYLGSDKITIYRNQCGNSWGKPEPLQSFPPIDNLSAVMALDLLGTGTACLVWSSPLPGDIQTPMKYIDLMKEGKPHLLTNTVNNLGAETIVRYAPSTKFYLKDKADGKPWITKLPFPVHVVERVETYDYISRNRFVTRYTYHHGYFDGGEREFSGFGRVEQQDTEQFATFEAGRMLDDADNLDKASHVPPVLTKTWFLTGAYIEGEKISRHFEEEYYREPGLTVEDAEKLLLDDTILPDDLSPEEEREACRALKGSMLRQEIYAHDGTDKEKHPYTVTEQNFAIRCFQPRGNNKHGVFFTHPREAINYHYERNPVDPRIAHTLTLEVDDFGNVLKSASIGYGRRQKIIIVDEHSDPKEIPNPELNKLDPEDQKKQTKTLITYTKNQFTNGIRLDDDYRTPLISEARTYELTGDGLSDRTSPFKFEDWIRENFELFKTTTEIAYEETADKNNKQNRLIEHVRTIYRKNDLTGLLALGSLESLALPGEVYKLVFTPGLLGTVYKRKKSDGSIEDLPPNPPTLLADDGGYRTSQSLRDEKVFPQDNTKPFWTKSDNDGHWWIPSGRVFYSSDASHNPSQELDYARLHFFLPRRYRDPFHIKETRKTETIVNYDTFDLLVIETRDALGNRVTAGERDTDPRQPFRKQGNDYRVLQPWFVMDPNRNCTEIVLDALGLVVGASVMSKPEDNPAKGDTLNGGFKADLTDAEISAFHNANHPHTPAADLLKDATTRIVYDLHRFYNTRLSYPQDLSKWEPTFAVTLARETHVSDLKTGEKTKIQISFSYSDGFGREIQKKIQAEPENTGGPLRWIGSGWTIHNNKSKPVRQYEPFFSSFPDKPHQFEFARIEGVSPILFYDPVERVIVTLRSNNTYEKVVFDPWQQTTYDVNDTVVPNDMESGDPRTDPDIKGFVVEYFKTQNNWEPWHQQRITGGKGLAEKQAAEKAKKHANTPTTVHFDTLGRTFLTIAHNRFERKKSDGTTEIVEEKYATHVKLDIEGNQRAVIDAKGRVVMRYDYDMLDNRIYQASMEAGERWILNDVTGKPIRNWDSRGHTFKTEYDQLRRPVSRFVRGMDNKYSDSRVLNKDVLFEKIEYGEDKPKDIELNLRTRVLKQYDGAGIVTNMGLNPFNSKDEGYDFKGNLLRSKRALVKDYKNPPNWQANPDCEQELFMHATRYDALNRPIRIIAPYISNAGTKKNVIQPIYNEANLLDKVNAWLEQPQEPDPDSLFNPAVTPPTQKFVQNINYNAKGQRELIEYGNGAKTKYEYDPLTFRLTNLFTWRGAGFPQSCKDEFNDAERQQLGCPKPKPQCKGVQNLSYTYDPAGNITHIQDDAQQTIYFRNRCVEPSYDYFYDAIYRLIEAHGREHLGQNGGGNILPPAPHSYNDAPWVCLEHPNDGKLMGTYIEEYVYDAVGNFQEMIHRGTDPQLPGWRREYKYEEKSLIEDDKFSNRLNRTTLHPNGNQPLPENYELDVHGNMTTMPHLKEMQWDFKDQLIKIDLGGGGTTFYVYDSAGQRVRKVWEKSAGLVEERIYLSGLEVFRKKNGGGAISLERETLHIMDNKQRIALVETRTKGSEPGVPAQLILYQFSNHLGSASLELDDKAVIISYEEYYPYGSTSYQAVRKSIDVPLKRYLYTGKERDEETGLYYYGARYYASWLGRWTAADPSGIAGGLNLFNYSALNPIRLSDPNGCQPAAPSGQLMGLWEYGQNLLNRAALGRNIQLDHPIQVALREAQRTADSGTHFYSRAISKAQKELTVIVETGKGLFHTELGKLQAGIRQAVLSGQMKSESNLVAATRNAYAQAARLTGTTVNELALDTAILSNQATLHTSLSNTINELRALGSSAATTMGEVGAEVDKAFAATMQMGEATEAVNAEKVVASASQAARVEQTVSTVVTGSRTTALLAKAAPVISAIAKPLAVAGKVAGPLGLVTAGVQLATAKNAEQKANAGITAVSSALMMSKNPVAMAAGGGLLAGQLIDQTLNVSDYSSRAGVAVYEKLKEAGLNDTASFVIGGVASMAAIPAAIPFAAVSKVASWFN